MKRRLFNLLAAVSLALAVGVVGLWIVGYWFGVVVQSEDRAAGGRNREYAVSAVAGAVHVRWSSYLDEAGAPLGRQFGVWARSSEYEPWTDGLWFGRYSRSSIGNSVWERRDELRVPLWVPTLLLLIAPGLWLRRARRQRRRRRLGLCLACGHDLRESPTQCPECGRPVPEGWARKRMA